MIEKRRRKRHNLACRVEYYTDKNPTKKIKATSFNLSLSGVGLKMANFINGENLNLRIFKPTVKSPIEAKGILVWQKRLPRLDDKLAGIKFTETSWS